MIAIAFAAHLLLLAVAVFMGEFSVRPPTPIESYTVEVVDDGELGGHMPAGLPKLDLGGQPAPRRQVAKAPAPKPEPKPEPKPKPEPEPEKPPEPPPAAPEPKAEPPVKEEPQPAPVAEAKPPREDDLIVATATPTATPTARPTAKPTATPRPTAKPTAVPTSSPHPTVQATPRATSSARPAATPQPTSSAPAKSPRPSPSAGKEPGAAPKPTQSPVVVVRGRPTPPAERGAAAPDAQRPQAAPTSAADARIAEALARVQRNVGNESNSRTTGEGSVHAPGGDARGAGGVGGTDVPDPNRRVGIGPGRGGAGEVRGVEFLLYYNQMLARIRDAWVYTGGATTAEVEVRFRILEDGVITDLRVTRPSGDATYDASVLRAVRGASPLGPPPAKYRTDFADVVLTFQPGDLKSAR